MNDQKQQSKTEVKPKWFDSRQLPGVVEYNLETGFMTIRVNNDRIVKILLEEKERDPRSWDSIRNWDELHAQFAKLASEFQDSKRGLEATAKRAEHPEIYLGSANYIRIINLERVRDEISDYLSQKDKPEIRPIETVRVLAEQSKVEDDHIFSDLSDGEIPKATVPIDFYSDGQDITESFGIGILSHERIDVIFSLIEDKGKKKLNVDEIALQQNQFHIGIEDIGVMYLIRSYMEKLHKTYGPYDTMLQQEHDRITLIREKRALTDPKNSQFRGYHHVIAFLLLLSRKEITPGVLLKMEKSGALYVLDTRLEPEPGPKMLRDYLNTLKSNKELGLKTSKPKGKEKSSIREKFRSKTPDPRSGSKKPP